MADVLEGISTPSAVQTGKRFAAFISYSHADEEFGDWLHKRLESYQVPSQLVGRSSTVGPIGKRLGKVFRDRADLSAAHDLGGEIREGLEQSDALIVLCSPRSCGSKYVHEEIRTFKQLGKGQRVFAAIIGGEPHAAGRPGFSAEDECFPPALIYALGPDGTVSSELEPTEPIAADFRKGKDGRENGALKIIAGLLDVGLDELVQREKQAERRRRLRANAIAMAMAVLAVGAVGAAIYAGAKQYEANTEREIALQRKEEAETAKSIAEKRKGEADAASARAQTERDGALQANAELLVGVGRGRLTAGDTASAAAYALEAMSVQQQRAVSITSPAFALLQDAVNADPFRAALRAHTREITALGGIGERGLIWSTSADGSLRIWDARSGTLVRTYDVPALLSTVNEGNGLVESFGGGGIRQAVFDQETQRFLLAINGRIVELEPRSGRANRIPGDKDHYFHEFHRIGAAYYAADQATGRIFRISRSAEGPTLGAVTPPLCGTRPADCVMRYLGAESGLFIASVAGQWGEENVESKCVKIDIQSGIAEVHDPSRSNLTDVTSLGRGRLVGATRDSKLLPVTPDCTFAFNDRSSQLILAGASSARTAASGVAIITGSRVNAAELVRADEYGWPGVPFAIQTSSALNAIETDGDAVFAGEKNGRVSLIRWGDNADDDGEMNPTLRRYAPAECDETSQMRLGGAACEVTALHVFASGLVGVGFRDGRIDLLDFSGRRQRSASFSGAVLAVTFVDSGIVALETADDGCSLTFRRYDQDGGDGKTIGRTGYFCTFAASITHPSTFRRGSRPHYFDAVFSRDGTAVVLSFNDRDAAGGYWFVRSNTRGSVQRLAPPADLDPRAEDCRTETNFAGTRGDLTVCAGWARPLYLEDDDVFITIDRNLRLHFWSARDGRHSGAQPDDGGLFLGDAVSKSMSSWDATPTAVFRPWIAAHSAQQSVVLQGTGRGLSAVRIQAPYKLPFEGLAEGGPEGPIIECVFFARNGSQLFINANRDDGRGSIGNWDTQTGRLIGNIELQFRPYRCVNVPGANLVEASGGSSDLALLDVGSSRIVFQNESAEVGPSRIVGGHIRAGLYEFIAQQPGTDDARFALYTTFAPLDGTLPEWARLAARRGLRDDEREIAFRDAIMQERSGLGCLDAYEWNLDPNRQVGRPVLGIFFESESSAIETVARAWVDCVANVRGDDLDGRSHFKVGLLYAAYAHRLGTPQINQSAVDAFHRAQAAGYQAAYLAEAMLLTKKPGRTAADLDRALEVSRIAERLGVTEAGAVVGLVMIEQYLHGRRATREDIARQMTGAACSGSFLANILLGEERSSQIARSFEFGPRAPGRDEVWLNVVYPATCGIPVVARGQLSLREQLAAQALVHYRVVELIAPEAIVGATPVADRRATLARMLEPSLVVELNRRIELGTSALPGASKTLH